MRIKKSHYPFVNAYIASAAIGSKIYLAGGYGEASPNAGLKYMKELFEYGASAVELNGKIYVFGGFNNAGAALTTLEVYDSEENSWSTKANMPEAKGYCGAVADGGIFAIGGSNGYNSTNTVYQYSPTMDKWYHWPGLEDALEGPASANANGGIYIICISRSVLYLQ